MAQPPNGTPGLPQPQGVPGQDYVDMPGVTPITPQSFPQGSPPNPGPAQPQAPITLPPVEITGTIPPNKRPPAPVPAPSQGVFSATPLGPREGVAEDARVFTDLADYYKNSAKALAEGKAQEAAQHGAYAQQLEQSIAGSKQGWAEALADQKAREARMTDAINKGKALAVDPDNYWNRKGTASNLLAAISVGLGAFGSGMTHGATGNPALTMVNAAIEHDIDSQKANIANYWHAVKQQQGLDDNAFNRALVTQNVEANFRLAGYKAYESKLNEVKANTDSQMVKLGAQKQIDDLQLAMNATRKQLAAQIAAQQAAAGAKMESLAKERRERYQELYKSNVAAGMNDQKAADSANKALDSQFPMLVGTPYASPGQNYDYIKKGVTAGLLKRDPSLTREDAEKQAVMMMDQQGYRNPYGGSVGAPNSLDDLSKDDRQRAVRDPNTGSITLFRNPEMANKYETETAPIYQARNIVNRLKAIRGKQSGGFIGSLNADDQKEVDILTNQLIGRMNQIGAAGVLNGNEYDRNKKIIPDATAYSNPLISKNVDEQLNSIDRFLQGEQQGKFQAYGGQAYSPNAAGAQPPAGTPAAPPPFTPYKAPGAASSAPPGSDSSGGGSPLVQNPIEPGRPGTRY